MAVANTLAYYDLATITVIKRFIAQALGYNVRLLRIDDVGRIDSGTVGFPDTPNMNNNDKCNLWPML
jgi:hypothetical protein